MKLLKILFENKKPLTSEKDLRPNADNTYIELANLVKEARCKNNLTKEDLSNISKIPLSIIVAIENNEKELIPEYPFIRSILLKLEECLSIRKFKLVNIVKEEKIYKNKKIKISYLTNKLDFINSWHGNIIYLLILLLSLLILNNYYINSRTIEFKFIEKNISK